MAKRSPQSGGSPILHSRDIRSQSLRAADPDPSCLGCRIPCAIKLTFTRSHANLFRSCRGCDVVRHVPFQRGGASLQLQVARPRDQPPGGQSAIFRWGGIRTGPIPSTWLRTFVSDSSSYTGQSMGLVDKRVGQRVTEGWELGPSSLMGKSQASWFLAAVVAASFAQPPSICAQADEPKPMWAIAAVLINGSHTGSGIYLTPGLVITAAHVAGGWTGDIQAHIAGTDLPAAHVKTGKFEDVDLALFSADQQKLPASVQQIQASLCAGPAWAGDPVIVVDREWVSRSRVVSPTILEPRDRVKFATLIARKFVKAGVGLAKYFVPASEIREFIPAELRAQVPMK